ncbi:MAG: hypothetical protein IJO88_00840 [Oscillospiraceae bacterium]|nr:hypothetical protein [Oscillospiraceae bacterium]
MKLEKEFQLQAMANAQMAMLAHDCPTKRLLQTLEEKGGVETVQELCKRCRASDGFNELFAKGYGALTLEALVIKGKYGALFTDEEVNFCLELLMEAGYF